MTEREFVDIDIVFERRGDGLAARVVDSPVGKQAPVDFVAPTADTVSSLVAGMRAASLDVDVQANRRIAPLSTTPAAPAVSRRDFGSSLFRALFNGPTLDVLRHSQYVVGNDDKALRLRLHFEEVPELASVPWELLYDETEHTFLAQFDDFSLVRVIDSGKPRQPLEVEGPVRMLVVISSPTDVPGLDVEREWQRLVEGVSRLVEAGRLDVVRLESATLDAVHDAVRTGDFHVLHFIGHGGVDADGEGVLAFMKEDGGAHFVRASVVRPILAGSRFRLIVLNACDGARPSATDPYGSTAIALVQHGVPAVVAMQFEVSDVAAIEFSRAFYSQLTSNTPIDVAMIVARQKILIKSGDEWATPVLYLRPATSVLFVTRPPAPPPPPPPPPPPVPEPSPQPGPPTPREPGRPIDLHGRATGSRVELTWSQPADPAVRVEAWEVARDAAALPLVTEPMAVDDGVPRGRHVYTVGAIADGGQRSLPSDPVTVTVRGRAFLAYVVAALVIAAAVALVILLSQTRTALAAPTHVRVTSTALPVALAWDPAPADDQVAHWEVLRDGEPIGTTSVPAYVDHAVNEAGHRYEVRAVGADGSQSPLSSPPVTPSLTTTSPTTTTPPTPTTTTTTTTTTPPDTRADLGVTFVGASPGAGSGETDLRFRVANGGPAGASEVRVDVALTGNAKIYDLQFNRGGEPSTACDRTTTAPFTGTCTVGELADAAELFVVVTVGGDSYRVTVDVASKDDPTPGNDRSTYPRRAVTLPVPTFNSVLPKAT